MEETGIVIDSIGSNSTEIPNNATPTPQQKVNDYFTNRREFNSLPKLYNGQNFDPYRNFATYAKSNNLCVNIPITLIRLSTTGQPYLVQSNKYGAITSKVCAETEFFNIVNNKNDNESPIYCYKTLGSETIFLYSRESAESLWNSNTDTTARIQHFIQSRSKPSSIIRVHWRVGMKSKFFLISNRVKYSYKQREMTVKKPHPLALATTKKRSLTMMGGKFRYTDMIFRTSKSINNPFKVNQALEKQKQKTEHFESQKSLISPSFYGEKSICEESSIISVASNTNNNPIVNPREIDSVTVIEDTMKVVEVEIMVGRVTKFLCDNMYRNGELSEMLLDFICDKDKKWVFLDCKEIILQQKLLPELKSNKRSDLAAKSMQRRSISYVELGKLKDSGRNFNLNIQINTIPDSQSKCPYLINTPQGDTNRPSRMSLTPNNMQKCPFSLNSPSSDSQKTPEPDFFERWNIASQKIDHAVNLKPSSIARFADAEEQSIKAYQARHNPKSESICEIPDNNSVEEEKVEELPNFIHNTSNSLWDDKYNDHINKCFTEVIDKIDEMNMNTELLKVKSRNLVASYGGDEFWTQFISSLYKKITVCGPLTKFFQHYNLQTIFNGMFKLFNGCATLDFRRRIKIAHETMGITEKEFNLYTDIFESTLCEHGIKLEDRHIIMTQIKSMKWLICRGKNNSRLI